MSENRVEILQKRIINARQKIATAEGTIRRAQIELDRLEKGLFSTKKRKKNDLTKSAKIMQKVHENQPKNDQKPPKKQDENDGGDWW